MQCRAKVWIYHGTGNREDDDFGFGSLEACNAYFEPLRNMLLHFMYMYSIYIGITRTYIFPFDICIHTHLSTPNATIYTLGNMQRATRKLRECMYTVQQET